MCGKQVESGISQIVAGLDTLAAADVVALEDTHLAEQLGSWLRSRTGCGRS